MPLTKTGKSVLKQMVKQYGKEKGKSVFYASINAKKEGSNKWHKATKKGYSSGAVAMAKAMRG